MKFKMLILYVVIMLLAYPIIGMFLCAPVTFICDFLNLNSWFSAICMYMMHVFSIGIVSFVAGLIFIGNSREIMFSALIHVIIYLLVTVNEQLFMVRREELSQLFSFSSLFLSCVPYIAMLIFIPFLSKWLYSVGGKFRKKNTKTLRS